MTQQRPRSRAVARPRPQEAAGPRLRVHPRRRLSGRALLLGGALTAFVVLAGAVGIQAQRIETQHTIDRLERELTEAAAEHRHLRARVAAAAAPEQVLARAGELELVEPEAVVPLSPPPSPVPPVERGDT